MDKHEQLSEEITLSAGHHAFKVVAREHQIPVDVNSAEPVPISSSASEDENVLDANVFFLNREGAYTAYALVEIPIDLYSSYNDPFRGFGDVMSETVDAEYVDEDTLILPSKQTTAMLVRRHRPDNPEAGDSIFVYPHRTESGLINQDPDFFTYDEKKYDPAAVIKDLGRSVSEAMQALQDMRGQFYAGQLTISLPFPSEVAEQPQHELYSNYPCFDDFGGLDNEIAALRDVILDLETPGLLAEYGLVRPSGILLQGPAGVGKTELVKALAREMQAFFNIVQISDITDMYVGKPVEKLREEFKEAKVFDGPYILFFDEFDGLFSHGAGGNSGVTRALVAEFKNILSSVVEEYPNVLVVAAANSIDGFDPALLRPGRFDTIIKIPAPNEAGRAEIFGKLLYKYAKHFDIMTLDTQDIASVNAKELAALSEDFTGADIKHVINGLLRKRMRIEQKTGSRPPRITQSELAVAIQQHRYSRPNDV